MVNYIGGSECFYDYVTLDELSILDIEDIAIELGYSLPMFGDLPDEGVCDGPDEVSDLPNKVRNGTSRVSEECDETLNEESAERAAERAAEGANDGADDELVETDYEQEEEDIPAETRVDPTWDWDFLRNPEIPREECGSGSEFDCHEDDLRSLDEFDGDEVEGGELINFSRIKYHEFDHFGSADVFRKAIMAHAVKHMRNIKFQKNNTNRVKAVCKDQSCNWFVFASWLGDHKTFKIKSLVDAHTCAMSFKNTFVNLKMIADKYLCQWRENPKRNFAEMSQQLRIDTNVDASIWQYYRARTKAKQMI
ncbi:hypothetical protein Dsin_010792 [Dipteronia sinensis]|uniref:Transposase MuDR plant domain-containing protein n=1 Tax=Dipteronia sinensis TaxID=43782 RepID=A0AAE0AUD1_9ROSI|nr:hypothetical protein Dsin_010792 [Dipteronia sinensis]